MNNYSVDVCENIFIHHTWTYFTNSMIIWTLVKPSAVDSAKKALILRIDSNESVHKSERFANLTSRSLFFDGMEQRYKYRRTSFDALSVLRCRGGRETERIKMRNGYKKVNLNKINYVFIELLKCFNGSASKCMLLSLARAGVSAARGCFFDVLWPC